MVENITWYETNMTSNTAPAPLVARASSEINTSYSAWKAFNGTYINYLDCWQSPNTKTKEWIELNFGEKKNVSQFKMKGRPGQNAEATPKNFKFLGSNDGTTYEELYVAKGLTWNIDEEKTFTLEKSASYRIFRIDIDAPTSTSGAYNMIGKLLFGGTPIQRKAILKNPLTNQHYSLAEKTLIPLPNASSKNMILHGIEAGKEIQLDEAFDKINYPVEGAVVKTMVKPLSIKFE